MTEKKLDLNISERVLAIGLLNEYKGNLDGLEQILAGIPEFRIEDEEWEKAERKINKQGENINWQWDDEKGGMKTVTVSGVVIDYIKTALDKMNKEGKFTIQDKAAISLYAKIK